jgi:hypothetical protein
MMLFKSRQVTGRRASNADAKIIGGPCLVFLCHEQISISTSANPALPLFPFLYIHTLHIKSTHSIAQTPIPRLLETDSIPSPSRDPQLALSKMSEITDTIMYLVDNTKYFALNFLHNIENAFNMDLHTFIRIVVVVGAYMLIRPYLVKGGAKLQEREHAKVYAADKEREEKARAAEGVKISPNMLRGEKGVVGVPEDTDSEAEAEANGTNWGGKARKRQRKVVKSILEADEKMRLDAQGDEDDKDIMEFLVDYEEGKDGW